MKHAHPATDTQSDQLDPARAQAFQIALGQAPDIGAGSVLPPFYHQLYFWSPQPANDLGRDGHPRLGAGLIPDLGLPRRMWAGGRLGFAHDLCAGVPAERHSTVESVEHKHGRSGPLAFVTLRHEFRQQGRVCLTEWQDLVYRQDPSHDAPRPVPPVARTDETDLRELSFDSIQLFRYSALTFNGHRIHYDRDYARDVEGYDGLVVHGPLLAQHLMLMARDLIGPLAQFSYRAASPLMDSETASFCRRDTDFWVRGHDGRAVMTANAVPML
ncbi:MAG: MaoC family dehydratase N-terminal domain-containing protein [Sedimentitalea sp.]|uniref:FAS1-like dehydratase domain-containing protein n=1 Tax=Sedimentitalea sp. TaxID=2048915 RepID=UPI003264C0DF